MVDVGIVVVAQHQVLFQDEEGRDGCPLHHARPVLEAQGVGGQDYDGVGPTPLHEGPEALAQV